jgi:hypothetical protein
MAEWQAHPVVALNIGNWLLQYSMIRHAGSVISRSSNVKYQSNRGRV